MEARWKVARIEEPPERGRLDIDRNEDVAPDTAELRDAVGAISAATARTLRAVARCAENRRFIESGFRSMTDWLSTAFPIGLATAKEWVFLSRKLSELPAIFEAFEAGRLTWKQLLPLARFATPETDEHWAEAAPRMYPAELYRELQRRMSPNLREERAAHASRYLRLVWDADEPVVYIEGRLGKEQGSHLEEAILERSRDIPLDGSAEDPSEARSADALVELATSGDGATAEKPLVVLHADMATMSGASTSGAFLASGGHRVHQETARRIACDAELEAVEEERGRVVEIGRKSPRVPGWLERQVRHRDGWRCRFPGCERRISLLSHTSTTGRTAAGPISTTS